MLFGFLRRKNKLSKKQFSEAKEKFSKMIIPHWDEFQKIIKANLKGFDQYYDIDENPDVFVSKEDLTVGCCLTFTKSFDNSKDECNSQLLDDGTINKILDMEDKIVRTLQRYCDNNNLDFKIDSNRNNWDDAGIYCSIDIGSLIEIHNESSLGIFEEAKFI